MSAFRDSIARLWEAFGIDGPPPAGDTAVLAFGDIEIVLRDGGRQLLVRGIAGPLAAREPHRSAQVRNALRIALVSLRRHALLVRLDNAQGSPEILIDNKIDYKNVKTAGIKNVITDISKYCHALTAVHGEGDDAFNGPAAPHDGGHHFGDEEFVFRL